MDNNIPDDLNPKFLFQSTHTNLLVQAIQGELYLKNLAMNELVSRGLDDKGNWIGFNEEAEFFRNNKRKTVDFKIFVSSLTSEETLKLRNILNEKIPEIKKMVKESISSLEVTA